MTPSLHVITSMKNCDVKFKSDAWENLKEYHLTLHENVKIESLYICSYCHPILNGNNIGACGWAKILFVTHVSVRM